MSEQPDPLQTVQATRSAQRGSDIQIKDVVQTSCCIVGGGPAGVMLAYLLARQRVPVTLLEAHSDFEREFRGDTIHPSVMEIMEQLGLADRLLQLRHVKMSRLGFQIGKGALTLADFNALHTHYPYVTIIPQAQFLDFMVEEAQRYPCFRLVMGAQVDELVEVDGKVDGVRYRGIDGWHEVRALLTIGCDGRFSRLRKLAGFEPIKTSPPMDVLWFRLPRKADDAEGVFGHSGKRTIVAMIDRGDYWQLGYVIPKGGYQQLRAQGIEQFRQAVAEVVPEVADRVDELKEWKQISVLSVESNRLPRWYRPGLLLIGDAAHVMSPIGGVGINYAVQDAVVVANLLSNKLKQGAVYARDLAKVQHQREVPVCVIQFWQQIIQQQVLARAIHAEQPSSMLRLFRWLLRLHYVHVLSASLIGYGLFPVRIKNTLLQDMPIVL